MSSSVFRSDSLCTSIDLQVRRSHRSKPPNGHLHHGCLTLGPDGAAMKCRGGRPGEVRMYAVNESTADVFKRAADRLYMWRWPWLPEEPSFYRADGSAVLITLPYDRLAWLELTQDELTELERRVPDLLLSRRPRKVLG